MLIDPNVSMLNACLAETKKLHDTEAGVSPTLISMTQTVIADRRIWCKIYALFVWMLIASPIRAFFGKGEPPQRYQRFVEVLFEYVNNQMRGRKLDGSVFGTGEDMRQANPGYLVWVMVQMYATGLF